MAQRRRHERGAGRWRLLGAIGLATGVMTVAVASDGLGAELRPRDLAGAAAFASGDLGGAPGTAAAGSRWSTSGGRASSSAGPLVAGFAATTTPITAAPEEAAPAGEGTGGSSDGAADAADVADPSAAGAVGGPGAEGAQAAGSGLLAPAGTSVPVTTAPISPVPPVSAIPPAASGAPPSSPPRPAVCEVEPLGAAAGLDSFYTQVCWAAGIPVVSSDGVDGRALQAAADIIVNMLAPRPDLRERLVAGRLRVGIIGQRQRAVDLPEYRDLPTNFPDTDWDAARAYGATPRRPLLAVPEENLLCSPADTYPGQSVLTHELGHTVLDMAVAIADSTFKNRVAAAFKAARTLPVYAHTYALVNADEYWAEGVQDFFDASRAGYGADGGGDGYDGPIASREALRANDPTLYGLIASVFTETSWRPSCPI